MREWCYLGGRATLRPPSAAAGEARPVRWLAKLEAAVWFEHRAWIPVAWLLSLANLASVWFAARPAEPWHATIHALLAVGFALGARRLTARRRANAQVEQLQQALDQNEHLQQTVDGMHARVEELEERVGFAERLLATHRDSDRLGAPPS
jgi:hypothetical protein